MVTHSERPDAGLLDPGEVLGALMACDIKVLLVAPAGFESESAGDDE